MAKKSIKKKGVVLKNAGKARMGFETWNLNSSMRLNNALDSIIREGLKLATEEYKPTINMDVKKGKVNFLVDIPYNEDEEEYFWEVDSQEMLKNLLNYDFENRGDRNKIKKIKDALLKIASTLDQKLNSIKKY